MLHFFMKKRNWFKAKGYTHLTSKITSENIGFINSYVSAPESIARHRFYPLLHRTIFEKKFKKIGVDLGGKQIRKHFEKTSEGKRKSTAKARQIFYANHLDAHIYSYYTQKILGPLYEKILSGTIQLSEAVLAYRRIELEDKSRCKCNIDFANDVFEIIKNLKGEYTVLAFDISKFFDSLNHKILKQKWCQLLNRKDLPEDHYSIYKSLIDFSYVEMEEIIKEFGFSHPNKLIQKNINSFLKDGKEFRERIKNKGFIKKNPFRKAELLKDGSEVKVKVGIPQGTPISAFLANLYMLDYDLKVIEYLNPLGGIYRRYSDDILVICPKQHENSTVDFILNTIKEFKLIIQKTKTQKTNFNNGRLTKGEKPLQYLGFEFNGYFKMIRSSSISKYYRNMKRLIKFKAARARKMKAKFPERAFVYKKEIYKVYSHFGRITGSNRKRNYLSYVRTASNIMGSRVNKQLSKSWRIINSEISRLNAKHNLLQPGEYEFHIHTTEVSNEEYQDIFPYLKK